MLLYGENILISVVMNKLQVWLYNKQLNRSLSCKWNIQKLILLGVIKKKTSVLECAKVSDKDPFFDI